MTQARLRHLSLYFHGRRELSEVREAMVESYRVLVGADQAPVLEKLSREAVEHPMGWSSEPAGKTRWAGPSGLRLEEAIEYGPGNPRDGWGFHMTWTLEAPEDGPLKIRVREADWEPRPKYVKVELAGPKLGLTDFDRVRAALRERFGVEGDRSDEPWMACENARSMLAAKPPERAAAETFLDRVVAPADGGQERWYERIDELRAKLREL